jgi:hypothetical protein
LKTTRSPWFTQTTKNNKNYCSFVEQIKLSDVFVMEFLNDLISVSSSSQLESVLTKFDTTLIGEEQKPVFIAKLTEYLENEFLANNAKIRRRIKRCIQSFDTNITHGKLSEQNISETVAKEVDLQEVIHSLYKAITVNHVQVALDAVVVPDKMDSGEHSVEFLVYRTPLKVALEHILFDEKRTNKVLRKRIKRLVFVLSTKEEQVILSQKSSSSSAPATNKKSVTGQDNKLKPSLMQLTPVIIPSKSFSDCFAELCNAHSPLEVENAISDVSVLNSSYVDLDERVAVHAKLTDLIENHKELVGNAKVRRMAGRLVDSLTKSFLKHDTIDVTTAAIKSSVYVADKWIDKPTSAETVVIKPKILDSFVVDTSHSQPASLNLTVPGGPLEPVIEKIRSVGSAIDLEDALSDVKPDSGSCSSRRTLKRAIERLLTQENIKESINAKIRRRITRVISMLEPQAHSERAKLLVQTSGEIILEDPIGGVVTTVPQTKIPYVVFIGQLGYSATEQDVENHLRTHGVEGDISVRLLKKTDSGESRGMAFVELEGARELHKCIALHHSRLQGRVINVEKTCGGKNKSTRAEKIQEKRREQMIKVHESVDKVLLEFHEKGVIDFSTIGGEFKDKIHRYTPGFVAEVCIVNDANIDANFSLILVYFQCMKIYSSLPENNRSLGSLDHILTSKDERARLGGGQKRGIENYAGEIQIEKKLRLEEPHNCGKSSEWPPEHPTGFGEHDLSRRSQAEKGIELRLDQVFSSRRGRGGIKF